MNHYFKDALLYFLVGLLFGIYIFKFFLLPPGQNLFLFLEKEIPYVPL